MNSPAATPATSNHPLVAGVDLQLDSEPAADQLLHTLAHALRDRGIPDPTLGTHRAQGVTAVHIAVSIEIPEVDSNQFWELLQKLLPTKPGQARGMGLEQLRSGPVELQDTALAAASEHRTRRSGRAAYFPGIDRLTGGLPVRDVLAWSSIERVSVLTGPDADPDAVLQTRNFLRPRGTTASWSSRSRKAPTAHWCPSKCPTQPPAAPTTPANCRRSSTTRPRQNATPAIRHYRLRVPSPATGGGAHRHQPPRPPGDGQRSLHELLLATTANRPCRRPMPAAGHQRNASRPHRKCTAHRLTLSPRARASRSHTGMHSPPAQQADLADQTQKFQTCAQRPAQIPLPRAMSLYPTDRDDLARRHGRVA